MTTQQEKYISLINDLKGLDPLFNDDDCIKWNSIQAEMEKISDELNAAPFEQIATADVVETIRTGEYDYQDNLHPLPKYSEVNVKIGQKSPKARVSPVSYKHASW